MKRTRTKMKRRSWSWRTKSQAGEQFTRQCQFGAKTCQPASRQAARPSRPHHERHYILHGLPITCQPLATSERMAHTGLAQTSSLAC